VCIARIHVTRRNAERKGVEPVKLAAKCHAKNVVTGRLPVVPGVALPVLEY
jgi:hypothetical protein